MCVLLHDKHEIMRRILAAFILFYTLAVPAQRLPRLGRATTYDNWTGTWAAAQQTPVRSYMPYNNEMTNRSVRQIIKVSAGGSIVRLHLSNELSRDTLRIRSVYIAHAKDSFAIDPKSAEYLRFSNRQRVTLPPGSAVVSDAERFDLRPNELLAVTINYSEAPKQPTVHMGSRTTSYILKGYSGPHTDFARSFRYEKWFNIAALDVYRTGGRSVAILGNSITDGKGSDTDRQNRWPDVMSGVLNSPREHTDVGVLNLGIGNNRVLTTGYGAPGKDRFDRDILGQSGVRYIIVFEGINDIGVSTDGRTTARQLIEQYKLMVAKAHARRLRIYGATITPMKGAGYFTPDHEAGREMVNEWIRTSGEFDGVIDFDRLMADPADRQALRPEWRLPDCLHPNALGYEQMGRYAAEFLLRELRK